MNISKVKFAHRVRVALHRIAGNRSALGFALKRGVGCMARCSRLASNFNKLAKSIGRRVVIPKPALMD